MAKTSDLTLEQLYSKPKITTSVEVAIKGKESFDVIRPQYCEKVCKLKCKQPTSVRLFHDPVDVLIIQDHDALDDGWKEGARVEKVHRRIIERLAKTNLRGKRFRLVNVMKCAVSKEDTVKGKPPTTIKQLKCAPYLLEEIRRSNPSVIISLTSNATKALGLKQSNYNDRGEIVRWEGRHVVLTLHPKLTLMIRQNASGKMWGPDYLDVINRDFQKAGRLATGDLTFDDLDQAIDREKKNIFIAKSLDDVEKMVRNLGEVAKTEIISFDTETTGLDPQAPDAKLLTIQFGFKVHSKLTFAYVIPLWHRENKAFDPARAWSLVRPLLEDPKIRKVGHNVKFDVLYIYFTTRVRVRGLVADTMLALHNLNSGIQGNYGLKRAVWDWIPHSGLGGYEDKLPKLTKPSELKDEGDEENPDERESEV